MGRFSSTVHIKNNTDRTRFIDSFCEAMKKRSLVPCSEDEAALSYMLAFSEGGWVTLTSEGYGDNSKLAYDDAEQTAKELKTSCFSVEVVDSDFAVLKLFGDDYSDEVIVGDGSGYGIEDAPKGVRKLWESLLADGKTWEQLSEAWERHEVFVEDNLCESAHVLGIESKYMSADYSELSDNADRDANIVSLYFTKEKEGKKSKPMTLNAAFIKVFGEGLEPFGFKRLKKIKNKNPFFVRVINGEILHIITYRTVTSNKLGYKSFEVLGGVATLYRRNLEFLYFTDNPQDWLITNNHLFRFAHNVDRNVMERAIQFECDIWGTNIDRIIKFETFDGAFLRDICKFHCKSDDSEAMLYGLQNAFDVTKSVMLNVLNKVNDLDSCIDFFYKEDYWGGRLYLCQFDEFVTNDRYSYSEGLIMIKTGFRDDDMKEKYKKQAEVRISAFGKGATQEDIDRTRKECENYCNEQAVFLNEMLNDPKINKRVMEELERCKVNNIEILKGYGLF